MKFGKELERVLEEHEIPSDWRALAIQYKALKKCINQVVSELSALGLGADILQHTLEADGGAGGVRAVYTFERDSASDDVRPHLRIELPQGAAAATPLTSSVPLHATLEDIVAMAKIGGSRSRAPSVMGLSLAQPRFVSADGEDDDDDEQGGDGPVPSTRDSRGEPGSGPALEGEGGGDEEPSKRAAFDYQVVHGDDGVTRVEVSMHADSLFFRMLSSEVSALAELEAEQRLVLEGKVSDIAKRVGTVVRPDFKRGSRKKANRDLYAWREVFHLYNDAAIFVSKAERDRGDRNTEAASKRYMDYIEAVNAAHLRESMSSNESRKLLDSFLQLNSGILRYATFQDVNNMALGKILKKFDKRTHLQVANRFPQLIDGAGGDGVVGVSSAELPLVRQLNYSIQSNLLTIVPQLEDFECPICSGLAFKPVRLNCSHVFCVRCLVRLQQSGEDHCPMCRSDGLMLADAGSIDLSLMNFLKLYFPREAKEKQLLNEKQNLEDQLEALGLNGRPGCVVM